MWNARWRPLAAAVVATACLGATAVSAQTWPNRPVSIIMPYPAGGPNDLLARLVAKQLSADLGGSFVVENRVGAAGNIAANYVAKAKPDGYTLLATSTGPTANNKFLFASLNFDPIKDFSSIVLVAKTPVIFTARKSAPFSTLPELIAYAKAHPGKLNIGTAGHGTVAHITSEFLQASAGIKMTNVPYPGSTPLISALLAEEIDVCSDLIPSHIPMLRDHRYKAIAITGRKRSQTLPDVPTVAESGLPDFEATAWTALLAPAGTPADVIKKINASVNNWLKSADGQARLAQLEMTPEGGSPADLDAFVASEIAKWGPIIKASGIKVQ